jgi:hypothetical protein
MVHDASSSFQGCFHSNIYEIIDLIQITNVYVLQITCEALKKRDHQD